jgi:3-oxoacyl-[acyl-carrier protein] reductase
MSSDVNPRIALITGASRGIGKAIALRLGQMPDMHVIGTATAAAGAETISHYLKEAGIQGQGMVLDISDSAKVEDFVLQLKHADQSPHVLINNAGITCDGLLLRMSAEDWSKVIQTNLTGTFYLIQACIRSMVKQRFGRIVNISSVVGLTGNPGQANYAASKAGLIGLTKSLARELGSRNVTANVVAPGFIDTDMTQVLNPEHQQKLLDQIPLGRMGQPAEVAAVVAFLVSTEAAYITGETIHVNGGMYMS